MAALMCAFVIAARAQVASEIGLLPLGDLTVTDQARRSKPFHSRAAACGFCLVY